MDLMKFINHIFSRADKSKQGARQQQAPAQWQGVPDITYNPDPNVDIPYSAHTMDQL